MGFYSVALISTAVAFIAFAFLTKFERSGKYARSSMKVYVECIDITLLNDLIDTLITEEYGFREVEITPSRSGIPNHIGIEATVLLRKKANRQAIVKKIARLDAVLCAIESV